jgi:protein ImuB
VNMVVADCKAIVPELQLLEYDPDQPRKLLMALAQWCMRYTPVVAVDLPDGLLFDASGCTHLWGGEEAYLKTIHERFKKLGYSICIAIADTVGCAWAFCRFGQNFSRVAPGEQMKMIAALPPAALRLDEFVLQRFSKLGLQSIGSFMTMPRIALRRRFGEQLLMRMDQALGTKVERLDPVRPVPAYAERLPSMEPIRTATGIAIALKTLLEMLCQRLSRENKGLRKCSFTCYRMNGTIQTIEVGTNRPSRNTTHLFRLLELKIPQIAPNLGIELFVLEATVVEELQNIQDALWTIGSASESAIAKLLDRIAGKIGPDAIHRFLPAEHYWPERSVKETFSLTEKPCIPWRTDLPRPLHLLPRPEPIEVSVPIPDYPPLLFKYKGTLHNIRKADGPERIEQEWWVEGGKYRDYYCVEDEQGGRYWLFRLGDYYTGNPTWFIHGFFA